MLRRLHGYRIEVLPSVRHAEIFQISTIQEPLTRPSVKLDRDERMSINFALQLLQL